MKARYAFLMSVTFIVLAAFIARLVSWQIVQYDEYCDMTVEKAQYNITGEALRGEIYDKNGEPLAVNLTGYRVVLNGLFIKDSELNGIIARLIELCNSCREKWTDKLPIAADSSGAFVFIENRQDETDELKKSIEAEQFASAKQCIEKLSALYGCSDYDGVQRRNIISVRYNMTKTGCSRTKPYVFAEDISEKSMAVISERMSGVKGVSAETYAVRTYLNGSAAPHIVGITGIISQEEYNELKSEGYSYTDRLGKSGIEQAYESKLRGKPGTRIYEEDEEGDFDLVDTSPARPGNTVFLTIDLRLQQAAQETLEDAVKEANEYSQFVNDPNMGSDCTGAALVVLDVRSFSVLCAANYPGYDLSDFYSDYEKLASDSNSPLFDRAFSGALAPGSTFKPLVACAALEENKIDSHTSTECGGVYKKNGLELHCMGVHGAQDLEQAMINSCNVFFAEAGRLLGIEKLDEYAKRFGLGVKTGVEIYESEGTLAGPEFSSLMCSEWYDGSVSQAAIGQSDNQFTPLQLAAYCAAIANGGKRYKTHVVDRIVNYTQDKVIYNSKPELIEDTGISENTIRTVQNAMYKTACSYDAFSDYPIKIAGKTGTAENNGSDHANFICYAPYDDPEIAVAVMVEHGAKSRVAVNAAKKILDRYFLAGPQEE